MELSIYVKYISSHVLLLSEFPLAPRTREKNDTFITFDQIYLVITIKKSKYSLFSTDLQYNYGGEQLRTRRRTAKMLIVVVVVFGLCYLPIYMFEIAR